jgi:phosphomevalonate kinase
MAATVLGLVGRAGSGKDTIYKVISDILGPSKTVVRVAFGDAVKEELAEKYGLSVEEIEEDKEMYRAELQAWGTEYRRAKDEDYWIKKLKPQLDLLYENADVVVITDIRFRNEADYVKDVCKGFLVKVLSNRVKKMEHVSETEQDSISVDWLCNNDGSVIDLAVSTAYLMEEMSLIDIEDGDKLELEIEESYE